RPCRSAWNRAPAPPSHRPGSCRTRTEGGRSASTCRRPPTRRSGRAEGNPASEIPLALLLLHRGVLVLIDQAPGAFGHARGAHFGNDLLEIGRRGIHGSRQRIAAKRAEPHQTLLRLLALVEPHTVVINDDDQAIAFHRGPMGREIQWYYVDPFRE